MYQMIEYPKLFGNCCYLVEINNITYIEEYNSIPSDAFENYCLYPSNNNSNNSNIIKMVIIVQYVVSYLYRVSNFVMWFVIVTILFI